MATQVQFRGGTTTEHASFNGAAREVTVDTTKQTLVVQDGSTNGGFPLLGEKNADNTKVFFGTDEDLQIYHDGTQSIIQTNSSTTKPLHIKGDPIWFYKTGSSELFCKMVADAGVELYFDGSTKLTTKNYGVTATGHFELDGANLFKGPDNAKLNLGSGDDLQIYHDGTHNYLDSNNGHLYLRAEDSILFQTQSSDKSTQENLAKFLEDDACQLYYDNVKKFETTSEGTSTTGRATITYAGSSSGKTTLTLGANNSSGSTSLTNSTSKGARLGVYHYTNAEEPAAILYAVGSDTTNQVNYGGGTSYMNAATHHKFFTADDITTTSGTEKVRIDGDGKVSINTDTPHCVAKGVHIKTGDSGVTSPNANRDDIFIEGSDHTGITISTANNKTGGIGFDDPDGAGRGRIQYSHSSDKMQIYTSGTNSFEFTDDLNILDGNLKVANGHGIDFSATSEGTGNSQDEIFTDYEKGLWVPTASDGCDGLTYVASRCVYTLIGKKVTLWAKISNPTNVDADTFQIGGLPFTPADHTIGTGMFHSFAITTTRTNGTAQLNPFVVAAGYNVIRLYLSGLAGDDGWTAIPGNFVTSNGDMYITVSYWIA